MKDDIYEPVSKQVNEKISHSIALIRLPMEVKELVICHFYTAEKNSKHYAKLFTEYEQLMSFDKLLRVQNVAIHEYLQNLKGWFQKLKWDNPDLNTEFYEDQLLSSLNIEDELKLLQLEYMQEAIGKIHQFNTIDIDREEFPVCYFTINRKRVLRASDELLCKYYNKLEEKMVKFQKLVSNSDIQMSTISQMRLENYDRILRNNFEAIKKGEPIMGACKACIQNFQGGEKTTYDKLIGKFESIKSSVFFP